MSSRARAASGRPSWAAHRARATNAHTTCSSSIPDADSIAPISSVAPSSHSRYHRRVVVSMAPFSPPVPATIRSASANAAHASSSRPSMVARIDRHRGTYQL